MLFFTGCAADLMNIELEGDIAKWEELNIQAEALISTLQLNNYSSEWQKNAKVLDEEIIQMNRQAEIKSEQLLGSRQYSKYSHLFRRIYMLSGDNDPEFTKKPASKIYQWKKKIRPVISQREYVRTHPSLNPQQKQCILNGEY